MDTSLNIVNCLDLVGKARKVKITEFVNNFLLITNELNCKLKVVSKKFGLAS